MKTLKITHWVMIAVTALLACTLIFLQCSVWHCYGKKADILEQAATGEAHADFQHYIDKAQEYQEKEAIIFPYFLTAFVMTMTVQAARIALWLFGKYRNKRKSFELKT